MKHIIIIALLTLSLLPIPSELFAEAPAQTREALEMKLQQTVLKMCGNESDMARAIMELRQMGIPMSRVVNEVIGDRFDDNPSFKQLSIRLVIEAYEEIAIPNREWQEMMITDFGDKAFTDCLRRENYKK